MRTFCFIAALLIGFCACSNPGDRRFDRDPYVPGPPGHTDAATTAVPPGPPHMKITTVGDVADAMGLHVDYLLLANNACVMNIECRHERGEFVMPPDQCEHYLAATWCRGDRCKESYLDPPSSEDDACIDEVRARSCDEMAVPLACEELRSKGLEFRPDDWPKGDEKPGPWPPPRGWKPPRLPPDEGPPR